MGDYYTIKKDNTLALDYFNRSLKIKKSIGDKRGMPYSLNKIGAILLNKNKYNEALTAGLENYAIATTLKYPELIRSSRDRLE